MREEKRAYDNEKQNESHMDVEVDHVWIQMKGDHEQSKQRYSK